MEKIIDELSAAAPGISIVPCACGIGAGMNPLPPDRNDYHIWPAAVVRGQTMADAHKKDADPEMAPFRDSDGLAGGLPACVIRLNDDSLPPR